MDASFWHPSAACRNVKILSRRTAPGKRSHVIHSIRGRSCLVLSGMRLLRRVHRPWAPKACAFHSINRRRSATIKPACNRNARPRHNTTPYSVEAIRAVRGSFAFTFLLCGIETHLCLKCLFYVLGNKTYDSKRVLSRSNGPHQTKSRLFLLDGNDRRLSPLVMRSAGGKGHRGTCSMGLFNGLKFDSEKNSEGDSSVKLFHGEEIIFLSCRSHSQQSHYISPSNISALVAMKTNPSVYIWFQFSSILVI